MRTLILGLAFALGACVSGGASPLDDLAAMQRRIDDRGLGFGLTRVPGHDAVAFQIRFRTSEADGAPEAPVDPMDAARAAAPEGCAVKSITPAEDGLSFTAEYQC